MTKQLTLDQRRAQHAWKVVGKVRKSEYIDAQDFAREVKRLPVRIWTAGLGQTLGFLNAKASNDRARASLLKYLTEWLLDALKLAGRPAGSGDRNAVLLAIMHGNLDLRRATEEALLYLQWLSRLAEAEFRSDD